MVAPLSIAAVAKSIISISCSLTVSMVFTLYSKQNASRKMLSIQHELQNVKQGLKSIQGLVGIEDEKLGHLG